MFLLNIDDFFNIVYIFSSHRQDAFNLLNAT